MMNVAQFQQGFAWMVLRSSPELEFRRESGDHRRDPKINGVIPEEERMDTEHWGQPTRRGRAKAMGGNRAGAAQRRRAAAASGGGG